MSEPTSISIEGRAFDIADPTPAGSDRWKMSVDDTDEWIGWRSGVAVDVKFLERDCAGTADVDNRIDMHGAGGVVTLAYLTVTLDQP